MAWRLRHIAIIGLALCTFPASAETPNVIVNYDVLNSLTEWPSVSATPGATSGDAAPSVTAVPESRLLVRPKKSVRRAQPKPAARKVPAPQRKPVIAAEPDLAKTDEMASAEAAAADQPEKAAEAKPNTAVADTPATPPASAIPETPDPKVAELPALQPATEIPEAPEARPLPAAPPPPPDAPSIAGLLGSAIAAEPSSVPKPPAPSLSSVPEPPAPAISPVPEPPEPAAIPVEVANVPVPSPPIQDSAALEADDEQSEVIARHALRILFDIASAELSETAKAALTGLAANLQAEAGSSVELRAHAAGTGSTARRTSLNRARAVRSFLVDKGVATTRIDVRPLGATSKEGPPDRVDIVFARR